MQIYNKYATQRISNIFYKIIKGLRKRLIEHYIKLFNIYDFKLNELSVNRVYENFTYEVVLPVVSLNIYANLRLHNNNLLSYNSQLKDRFSNWLSLSVEIEKSNQ